MKLKDKKRKRKQHHPDLNNNTKTPVNINSSTERVRKHRQRKKLITNLPFTLKNTKKVRKAAVVIKNSLPGATKSKARTLINVINSQSPIISNTNSTSNATQEIDLTLYNTLKRKCNQFSNCSRQLVMKVIADQK